MARERPVDPAAGPGPGVGDALTRGRWGCFCYGPSGAAGCGGARNGTHSHASGLTANTAPVWPARSRTVLAMSPASESRDGQGAGDRDREYIWNRPRELLSLLQQARLTIMRGWVMDTKRGGERRNCASGDLAYTEQLESGLIVPTKPKE